MMRKKILSNSFRSKREGVEKRPTRYYSTKQENTIAETVGGKRQKNSGATE